MRLKLCTLSLCLLPVLAACSSTPEPTESEMAAELPSVKLASECARLQPLFPAGAKELTREQMDNGLKAELAKWDKDGSGDLTSSEVEPLNDALRAQNVGASPVTDWNGDGRVDMTEFAAGWRTMFDLCDRNGNKKISFTELGYSPNVIAPRTSDQPTKLPEGASQPNPNSGY